MGDYFVHKITAIRSKLADSTQSPLSAAQEYDYTTTLEMTDLSFSEFALLTEEDVKNLALAWKKFVWPWSTSIFYTVYTFGPSLPCHHKDH